MSKDRRRYRIVAADTKAVAVDTVVEAIKAGDSFTSTTEAVAEALDVSATTVRAWVNASGRRPRPSWEVARKLERQLNAANELSRRLEARLAAGFGGTGADR